MLIIDKLWQQIRCKLTRVCLIRWENIMVMKWTQACKVLLSHLRRDERFTVVIIIQGLSRLLLLILTLSSYSAVKQSDFVSSYQNWNGSSVMNIITGPYLSYIVHPRLAIQNKIMYSTKLQNKLFCQTALTSV